MPLSPEYQALVDELEAIAATGHRPASMRQAVKRLQDAQSALDAALAGGKDPNSEINTLLAVVRQTAQFLERERR